MGQWERFLEPYKQAVSELKVKLKGMRTQYEIENTNSPIEFVRDVSNHLRVFMTSPL